MTEELSNILEGKTTLIKNKQYLSAKAYIEPFIKRMDEFKATYNCQVKTPDQLSITDGKPDLVYNRVHIQAILPEIYYNKFGCRKVVGMIYGLDVKTPIAKFYISNIDKNGNLIAFDPNAMLIQKLESATPIDFTGLKSLMELTDNSEVMLKQLQETFIDRNKFMGMLGEWIDIALEKSIVNDGGKVKLATSLPVDVYKSILKDKDSGYYISETEQISMLDLYKTFASKIREDDKDIINRFEKTLLVNKVLKI